MPDKLFTEELEEWMQRDDQIVVDLAKAIAPRVK